MSRWTPRRAVPPPLDPRQRQVVEKLAEFRARNGEAFVDVVRSKHRQPPVRLPRRGARGRPGGEVLPPVRGGARLGAGGGGYGGSLGTRFRAEPTDFDGDERRRRVVRHERRFPRGLDPVARAGRERAAGGRNEAKKNAAYTPIHPNDIPARTRARKPLSRRTRSAWTKTQKPRGRTSRRSTERFARDPRGRRRRAAERQGQARAEVDGLVRERRREELERIRHGDEGTEPPPGAVKKTWPSRGKRGGRGGGGGGGGGASAGLAGLGLGRAEEARDDAFAAFRKKRSGTYHAMIGADRGNSLRGGFLETKTRLRRTDVRSALSKLLFYAAIRSYAVTSSFPVNRSESPGEYARRAHAAPFAARTCGSRNARHCSRSHEEDVSHTIPLSVVVGET